MWIIACILFVSILFVLVFWAICYQGAHKEIEMHEAFERMIKERNNTVTSGSAVENNK